MSTDYYKLAMKYRDLFISANDEVIRFLYHVNFDANPDAFEISKQIKNILEEKRQELKEIDKGN